MKKCKKAAKGQRFGEGAQVRSLRDTDQGEGGVVVGASRKRTGWAYSILFDERLRVETRGEDELREDL